MEDLDVGYDGVLDVPDEPLGAQPPRCPLCRAVLDVNDDPDCGEDGCPVVANAMTLADLRRQ